MSNNLPYRQFGYFAGINTVDDDKSLTFKDLREAINVYLDNKGKIIMRDGFTEKITGSYRSMWSDGNVCFGMEGGTLTSFDTSFNKVTIASGFNTNLHMSFKKIVDKIFYSNGEVIRVIQNGISRNLIPSTETSFKIAMKAGVYLANYNGRLWTAKGNIIYFSDTLSYETADRRKYRLFVDGNITMLQEVNDGIYVSYGGNTYFIQETEPYIITQTLKLDTETIPYTSQIVSGSLIGKDGINSEVAMWASNKGICIGTKDGSCTNLTVRRHSMPTAFTGASLYKKINNGLIQFISILQN